VSTHPGWSADRAERVVPDATSRLRFRDMVESDLSHIASLDTGGSRGPQGWIDWTRRNYAQHGFGLWVVETHGGDFVGDCGLTVQEVEGEPLVEAGWHVRSDLRRRGYAAEAATSVRETARRLRLDHLIAIIHPDNTASQGVASSIGMVWERDAEMAGGPVLIFGMDLQVGVGPVYRR